MPTATQFRSFIGDAGHFLDYVPALFANNPDGTAFELTVHRYLWPTHWEEDCHVTITGPDGQCAAEAVIEHGRENVTINVSAGSKGAYAITIEKGGYCLF